MKEAFFHVEQIFFGICNEVVNMTNDQNRIVGVSSVGVSEDRQCRTFLWKFQKDLSVLK